MTQNAEKERETTLVIRKWIEMTRPKKKPEMTRFEKVETTCSKGILKWLSKVGMLSRTLKSQWEILKCARTLTSPAFKSKITEDWCITQWIMLLSYQSMLQVVLPLTYVQAGEALPEFSQLPEWCCQSSSSTMIAHLASFCLVRLPSYNHHLTLTTAAARGTLSESKPEAIAFNWKR